MQFTRTVRVVFNKNLAEIAIVYSMPGLSMYLYNDNVIDNFFMKVFVLLLL